MNKNVSDKSDLDEAIERVENLYQDANVIQDYKTALSAAKEKSKLLGLYKRFASLVDNEISSDEETIDVIRQHLESLEMAPPGLPIEDLARRIVIEVGKLKCHFMEMTQRVRVTDGNATRN